MQTHLQRLHGVDEGDFRARLRSRRRSTCPTSSPRASPRSRRCSARSRRTAASTSSWRPRRTAGLRRRVLLTLVPIRPRRRGERRSLRTFAGVSLRPPLAFNPAPSTPFNSASDAFELHPDIIARMERPSARGFPARADAPPRPEVVLRRPGPRRGRRRQPLLDARRAREDEGDARGDRRARGRRGGGGGRREREARERDRRRVDGGLRRGAFYTLVPIRPRSAW